MKLAPKFISNAQSEAPGRAPQRSNLVRLSGICKRFKDDLVLSEIDLDVAAGEVLALIGPSGSGKSTLLRCINLLETPSSGTVYIDGQSIWESGNPLLQLHGRQLAQKRQEIGMVFQRFNLFPHLTVLENVTIGLTKVLRLSKAEAQSIAREFIGKVGLSKFLDAYPATLSGGQQQRVAISRALAMRPKLMLFDEPTASLDPELVGEVLDVMRMLANAGTTMIIVTHEMHFAAEIADRVAFLDGGKILEIGPAYDVLRKPQHTRTAAFLAKVLSRSGNEL
ncbi:amino acid ABC transporter ATP-binding protein [Brenneria tiliae]|uniref:Amino acid ABC transporter ATP-binding protein n=1 Tax=Brenneria tiliae TaxID=2914984 RepID=A0ABT0MP83_9GAMM|nr:amino acid ABC transporter ATP-binding protein [Brenneria tiliae]MCL2891640.1 amino acid ABC transporter ATP-binding protein [Brenneria tiliae]